ncbi:MAG: ATP-binding protein, partial [Candidatus Nanohaloarchaea archaeon]|nr:ATP-binding protein [Candidatus Nanohaloarchaea archaeon]
QIGGHVYEIGSDADRDDIVSLAATDSEDDARFLSFEPKNRAGANTAAIVTDIVHAVYQATSEDDQRTIVVVDECHRLLTDDEGKHVISQFVREARDTNTGVTLLSQNASDFTATTEGRALLDNVETIFLMQHERVPDSVIDYFDLSQREAQELYSLKTGTDCEYSEAIVKVSDRRNTKVRITASDQEHGLIVGDAGEVET